jgi:hypothetical protein
MAKACCHNCIYSCWDLCQVTQSLLARRSHRPMCANQPEAPGVMRPTPIGRVCRNYRPRPATPEGDVRRIPLSGGMYAYVDAADYEWLSRYGWQVYAGGYAARHEKGKVIFMHREIMQPPEGMVVDHIDSNKGNNCRLNLRVCTPAENCHNRVKRAHSTSRFLGVSYNKRLDKYSARLHYNGKAIFIGYFDGEVEAARAYDHKAVECCGRFARVNLPEEWPPERIQQVYADAQARREAIRPEAAQAKTRKGTGKKASAKGQKQKTKGKNKKSDAKRTTQPARRVSAGRRTRVARRQTKSRRPGRKT